jgi:formylglycine-generating enzyme required for sulfatase activity
MVRQQDGATMVYVPAGEFLAGSPAGQVRDGEQLQQVISLDAFWIDQTEVTNAQYNQCVASGICTGGNAAPEWANYPVTDINWNQAKKYCRWAAGKSAAEGETEPHWSDSLYRNQVGARLPTEAEWEKAARGTDGRTYPWGEGIDCNRTRYDGEGCDGWIVLPVGSLPAGASPYGALDMAGNVAEWVAEPGVVRGGNPYAFREDTVEPPESLRTAWRTDYFPDAGTPSLGFRCAQSP